MKISSYVCVRNATLLDYPFQLAVESLVPVSDEVVVSVGQPCDDDTMERAIALQGMDSRVRVTTYPWDYPHADLQWWTRWLNYARAQLQYPVQLTLDADEVIDPGAYDTILRAAAHGECRWFHRLNYWGDCTHICPHGTWCGEQVVRLAPTALYMPSDEPHPEGEPECRVRAGWPPNADESLRIHHLGALRIPAKFVAKSQIVQRAFFGCADDRLLAHARDGTDWRTHDYFAGQPLIEVPFRIPAHCHAWLSERGHDGVP